MTKKTFIFENLIINKINNTQSPPKKRRYFILIDIVDTSLQKKSKIRLQNLLPLSVSKIRLPVKTCYE